MKNNSDAINKRGRGKPSARPGKLQGLLFLGCLLFGGEALASVTYRMVGGTCTDSNRPEITYYTDEAPWGTGGPGPKVCADSVIAEITMADGYIPGTLFSDIEWPPEADTRRDVLDFTFSDGARTIHRYIGAPPADGPGTIDGALPATMAPAEFVYIGNSLLRTRLDGTWEIALALTALAGLRLRRRASIGS